MKQNQPIQNLESTSAITCFITAVLAVVIAFGVRVSGRTTARVDLFRSVSIELPNFISGNFAGNTWGVLILTYLTIAGGTFFLFVIARVERMIRRRSETDS